MKDVTSGAFAPFFRALLATLLVLLAPSAARADAKSCIASHANGQREQNAGHLVQAAQLFTSCGSDDSCPQQLRGECAEMLERVRTRVPSVIFSVVDGLGKDVATAQVFSGETLLTEELDGRSIEMDPGKHHFRFVLADGKELTSDALIREGEKNRLIQVKLEPVDAPAPAVSPGVGDATRPPEPALRKRGVPAAAWVATGGAVAGAAVFTTFAVIGSKKKRELDDCAPNCTEDKRKTRDDLKRDYLIADIGLGVGAVSAVVAVVLFATSGGMEPAESAEQHHRDPRRTRLEVTASHEGGGFQLSRSF